MIALLKLGGGLLLLIVANIALGSIQAAMAREWDTKTFVNGLIKGGIVIGAFAAVYFAGWLNPDLVVVEMDGQTVNLAQGVYIVLLIGFTYYAGKVLLKLKEIVTAKSAAVVSEDAQSKQVSGQSETAALSTEGAKSKVEADNNG